MLIPCDKSSHWRQIRLLLVLQENEIDHEKFKASLDRFETITDSENPDCYSRVSFEKIDLQPLRPSSKEQLEDKTAEQQRASRWLLEILTYKSFSETSSPEEHNSHKEFFTALVEAVNADPLLFFTSVDLVFPSDSAKWRMPLLQTHPELPEPPKDLGRISLEGITLRFRDSASGLFETRLEVSPDRSEYLTGIRFRTVVPRSEIKSLYETVNTHAEHFAALFVDFQT